MVTTSRRRIERRSRGSRGFAYLVVLFALAVFGVGMAAIGQLWSRAVQQEREDELIRIGTETLNAIAAYYQSSPGIIQRYPPALEDLLEDRRQVGLVRYLRRVYRDPITNQAQWGLVTSPEGGISGIFSLSEDVPLRQRVLDIGLAKLPVAPSYREWKFVYDPKFQPISVTK